MKKRLLALGMLALSGGCQKAIRETVYSAYEKVGVHKRDLLRKEVSHAREEQQQATEQFADALTRLKALYGFEGGELERRYDQLKRDYDRSARQAEDVHKSVRDVETVASDLFREWESEIAEISTPSLREESRRQLRDTQQRYTTLRSALLRAEHSMEPALTRFHDHVLFLKHNLNARALSSLKTESARIEGEVARLIREMNASIRQAESFLQEIP